MLPFREQSAEPLPVMAPIGLMSKVLFSLLFLFPPSRISTSHKPEKASSGAKSAAALDCTMSSADARLINAGFDAGGFAKGVSALARRRRPFGSLLPELLRRFTASGSVGSSLGRPSSSEVSSDPMLLLRCNPMLTLDFECSSLRGAGEVLPLMLPRLPELRLRCILADIGVQEYDASRRWPSMWQDEHWTNMRFAAQHFRHE
mmetsp:Transcript_42094/g.98140  ORF Transcript_42094/g.98140 Transcript_42094/m.98140 type:complete len:203 (+) Transcript_42094:340-948(+)